MMDFKIFLLLLLQALIQESYAKSTSSNHRQKQGFGQVLVATGVIKENGVLVHTNKVESVDLDSDSSVCSTVDNFPSPRDGAFVAMMKGGGDMICGGFKMETLGDCYWIKPTLQWQHQTDFDLKNRRRFATAVTSYFMGTSVFGGESETNQLDSLEITRGYGWETLSTSPETMSRNCMTTFPGDQFKFFAIGGLVGNERFSDKTYIFDTRTSKWSNGTSLNVGREFHSCSLISPGFVIVVGGSNQASVLDSVEIFDVTTQQWSFGPQLDTKIYLASLTSTPNGGVALIGGNDGSEVLSSIYLLADVNPGSEWVKLSRSLAHPRRSHEMAPGCVGVIGQAPELTKYDMRLQGKTMAAILSGIRSKLKTNGKLATRDLLKLMPRIDRVSGVEEHSLLLIARKYNLVDLAQLVARIKSMELRSQAIMWLAKFLNMKHNSLYDLGRWKGGESKPLIIEFRSGGGRLNRLKNQRMLKLIARSTEANLMNMN